MTKRRRTHRTLLRPPVPTVLACADDCDAIFYGTPAEAAAAGWEIDYPDMKLRARYPFHTIHAKSMRGRFVPP